MSNSNNSIFKHIKADQWELFGTTLSTEYINRMSIPMMLDSLGWSSSYVLAQLESASFPYTRHWKLTKAITEREEVKAKAEREACEQAERIASMYPDPKEVARKQQEREETARRIREHGAQLRAARGGRGNYHDFVGGGITASGDWDN